MSFATMYYVTKAGIAGKRPYGTRRAAMQYARRASLNAPCMIWVKSPYENMHFAHYVSGKRVAGANP